MKTHIKDVWMRYSFVSDDFLTVEEAREWVFCIAYFLKDTPPPVVIKPEVEAIPDDEIEISEMSLESGEFERQVFKWMLVLVLKVTFLIS